MTIGKKYDSGKPRMDLLPPLAVISVAEVLAYGAEKYGANNWRLVDDCSSRYVAAALRHIFAWMAGEPLDTESHLHHLAHAACSILFALENEKGNTK